MDNSLDKNSLNDLSPTDKIEQTEKQILEEHQIALLEEKLLVKRQKLKVGEVIIRKQIETRIVHLPIRREKLIVEKAGTPNEYLTEIDLGEGRINGVKFSELTDTDDIYLSQSDFIPIESAQKLLAEVSDRFDSLNVKVRVEIVSENAEAQTAYQDIGDRH